MSGCPGDFIWYELMTTDPDAAAKFYGRVVGWRIAAAPGPDISGPDYRMIVRDDGGHAGGVLGLTPAMCEEGAHPMWMPYLQVPDVDTTLQTLQSEGGRVLMPATDLPVGRIAMVADPQDIPIYVMDPIPPAGAPDAGSDVFSGDALQRVGWNELASPDLEASRAFYARQFGFEFNESMSMGDGGDYCFIDRNGRRLGAMLQRQDDGRPAAWQFYFRVASIEAATAAVRAGNGSVVLEPMEVPGGDWIIVAADPQGAVFGLVGARN